MSTAHPITIRLAGPADSDAVRSLAQLDSAAAPAAPIVLAEVAGAARAALSVADGRAVADPFFPTRHLVALLELHAAELRTGETLAPAAGGRRRRWPLGARAAASVARPWPRSPRFAGRTASD